MTYLCEDCGEEHCFVADAHRTERSWGRADISNCGCIEEFNADDWEYEDEDYDRDTLECASCNSRNVSDLDDTEKDEYISNHTNNDGEWVREGVTDVPNPIKLVLKERRSLD
jgi:hypothetical protein